MKRILRSAVVFALMLAMVVSISACGSPASSSSSSTSTTQSTASASTSASANDFASKPLVTLKIVYVNNMGGINNTDAVSTEIDKKLNIKIEYSDNNEDKYKLMLASGDLGDIVQSSPIYNKQLVEGGNVIPIEGLLNSNGKDILANSKVLVDYSKKYLGFGQDKLFFLPVHGTPNIQDAINAPQYDVLSPYVRWDYYNELGAPAIKSSDDFLKLLADIQNKHPKTADGKKTYGLALHTEWNGWAIVQGWPPLNYGYWGTFSNISFFDGKGEFSSVLDDSNPYWSGLDFYYKAHKMGLLDPDSFTQKNANVVDKIKNGQVFATNNNWFNSEINAALAKSVGPDAGMGWLAGAFPHTFKGTYSPAGWGADKVLGITAACKNPDRAMDLLNYINSYEGARLIYSGVKGVHWDVVDGKPAMKDEIVKQKNSDPDFQKKTGIQNPNLGNMCGIDNPAVNPEDGAMVDLFKLPKALATQNNDFLNKYCAQLGVSYPGEAVDKAGKEGKTTVDVLNTLPQALLTPLSDDNKRIASQALDYLIKSFAKAVLSKSDADYAAQVKTMKEDLKKMGVDKLVGQEKADFQKAWTDASSFSK